MNTFLCLLNKMKQCLEHANCKKPISLGIVLSKIITTTLFAVTVCKCIRHLNAKLHQGCTLTTYKLNLLLAAYVPKMYR